MSNCHVSNQVAKQCNEDEAECSVCSSPMTSSLEGGYEILICDSAECGHKVWADGDEY